MKLEQLIADVHRELEDNCDMVEFKSHVDGQGNVCTIELKYVPKDYTGPALDKLTLIRG